MSQEIPAERLREAAIGLANMGLHGKALTLALQARAQDRESVAAALLCGDLQRTLGDLKAALASYLDSPSDHRCGYAAAVLAGKPFGVAPRGFVPAPFVYRQNFLPPDLQLHLRHVVSSHKDDFTPARVIGHAAERLDPSARRARVLHSAEEVSQLFRPALEALIDELCEEGLLDSVPDWVLDLQVTHSSTGDFYRKHRDKDPRSPISLRRRKLTFVYYLHSEPRDFAGGMLRLYDREATSSRFTEHRFTQIEPLGNSIVIFAPHEVHEITPVEAGPAGQKGERWTLNGWLSAPARSEMIENG